MDDFDHIVLRHLEALFDDGEVETLTSRPDSGDSTFETAVKVVHAPTGIEVVGNDCRSQTQNKSIALIRLIQKLGIER